MDKWKHKQQICEINKRHKAPMILLSLKPTLKWTQENDTLWKTEAHYTHHSAVHAALQAQTFLHNLLCMHPYVHTLMNGYNDSCNSVLAHPFVRMQSSTKQGNPNPTATSCTL